MVVCVRSISDVLSRVRVGLPERADRDGIESVVTFMLHGELVSVGAVAVEGRLLVCNGSGDGEEARVSSACSGLVANACRLKDVDRRGERWC